MRVLHFPVRCTPNQPGRKLKKGKLGHQEVIRCSAVPHGLPRKDSHFSLRTDFCNSGATAPELLCSSLPFVSVTPWPPQRRERSPRWGSPSPSQNLRTAEELKRAPRRQSLHAEAKEAAFSKSGGSCAGWNKAQLTPRSLASSLGLKPSMKADLTAAPRRSFRGGVQANARAEHRARLQCA